MNSENRIGRLAELLGLDFAYTDGGGTTRHLTPEDQATFLACLGFDTSSPAALDRAIRREEEKPWKNGLPPVRVLIESETGDPWRVHISAGAGDSYSLRWRLDREDGTRADLLIDNGDVDVLERRTIDGREMAALQIPPPPRAPQGYHRAELRMEGADRAESWSCAYIVTPSECWLPPAFMKPDARRWGVTADLYGLKSADDWGAGDLGDLRKLVEIAGSLGAAVVGLNPLHLTWNAPPAGISPYYPVSRFARNPLYLDLESVDEVRRSADIRTTMASAGFHKRRARLSATEFVEYDKVARTKLRIARMAFETFMTTHYGTGDARDREFQAYCKRQGSALRRTATFIALRAVLRKKDPRFTDWRTWPEEYRDPDSEQIRTFVRDHNWDVLFHEYLQWCIDDQLENVQRMARRAGLSIGLYHDLAVGSDPAGADTWAHQHLFSAAFEMGAPPDAFNARGQKWGVPPMVPRAMMEDGYAFFTATIRTVMEHGGAVRIDHILGFFRSFWIPRGAAGTAGAYVRYPTDDLLRIVALESHRNKSIVIGEDLGVVTAEIHATLRRYGILSSRILYFERLPDTSFSPPSAYPHLACTTANTHDLPTLAGWWRGEDIELKKKLGLFPEGPEDLEGKARWERGVDRWWLLTRLHSENLLPGDYPREPDQVEAFDETLRDAVWGFLGRTESLLTLVGLHDVCGMIHQQNLPGTIDEYPSWRRRLAVALDTEMFFDAFQTAAKIFGRFGRTDGTDRPDTTSTTTPSNERGAKQ